MDSVSLSESGQASAVESEPAEFFKGRSGQIVRKQSFKYVVIPGELGEYIFPVYLPVVVSAIVIIVLAGQAAELLILAAAETCTAFDADALSEMFIIMSHSSSF